MIDIKLTEIMDVEMLQKIQDGFASLTGMAALTTDASGAAVTNGSNFTQFCMEYTRQSVEGKARCEECDKMGGTQTMRSKRPTTYTCHAGLVDFAAPIMLNNVMIGSFIGGQVLPVPPDEEKFRKIAVELDINPDNYIKALRKIKIVEKSHIENAADYLFTIANVLSTVAYSNYLITQSNSNVSELNAAMQKKVDDAESIIAESLNRMDLLSSSCEKLLGSTEQSLKELNITSDMVKNIQNVAMNTRVLGFNASIEATRGKESGKGFGVIAHEIRALAETSKSSADSIQDAMMRIKDHSNTINENVVSTIAIIDNCVNDLKMFSTLLAEIKDMGDVKQPKK